MSRNSTLVPTLALALLGLAGLGGAASAQAMPGGDASTYSLMDPGASNSVRPLAAVEVPSLAAALAGAASNPAGAPVSEALYNTAGVGAGNGERPGHLGLGRAAQIAAAHQPAAPVTNRGATQPIDPELFNNSGAGAASGTRPLS